MQQNFKRGTKDDDVIHIQHCVCAQNVRQRYLQRSHKVTWRRLESHWNSSPCELSHTVNCECGERLVSFRQRQLVISRRQVQRTEPLGSTQHIHAFACSRHRIRAVHDPLIQSYIRYTKPPLGVLSRPPRLFDEHNW